MGKSALLNQLCFWLIALLTLIGYYYLCFETNRTNFNALISIYTALFVSYFLIIQYWSENLKLLIGLGILSRLLVLFAFPNLSDDIYRFLWDGYLINCGTSPYLHLPSWYIDQRSAFGQQHESLYLLLNSKQYFSIYPPILQGVFGLTTWLIPQSIYGQMLVLKTFIFLSEIGSLLLIYQLLRRFNIYTKHLIIYALNPLVIVELCGNLHFEAFMIFFLLLAVYLLDLEKAKLSAVAFAFAVCCKLLPLMFLPFLIKRLGLKQSGIYFSIVTVMIITLFAPFLSMELCKNIFHSIDLYFRKFEFNASIYYLVRWIGFEVKGWNIIQTAGPILSTVTLILITSLALNERVVSAKSLFHKMSWSLIIYFAFATTIHPWYITTLVAFSVFWSWRFTIIWSALIPLSYFAYSNTAFNESLMLIACEYILVLCYLLFEWRTNEKSLA